MWKTQLEKTCHAPGGGSVLASDADVTHLILITGAVGLLFAAYLMHQVAKVKLQVSDGRETSSLMEKGGTLDQVGTPTR